MRAKRVLKWGQAGVKPASITVSEANGNTIRTEIEKGRGGVDIVLIDVEGSRAAAGEAGAGEMRIVRLPPEAPVVGPAVGVRHARVRARGRGARRGDRTR